MDTIVHKDSEIDIRIIPYVNRDFIYIVTDLEIIFLIKFDAIKEVYSVI